MGAFLWVEDFDGPVNAPPTFQGTTWDVFDTLAGRSINEVPNDKDNLIDHLEMRNIFLKTNLVDALLFISDEKKLSTIDYVILDIDLKISDDPEDEIGITYLDNIFLWYKEFHDEKTRRSELKKLAGYHIWAFLVIDKGFPRDRIQYCSQHGNFLESIDASFRKARISSPEVFRKGDGKAKEWIRLCTNNPYTTLRRNVINYCNAVLRELKPDSDDLSKMIRLSQFPGKGTSEFRCGHTKEMLETLSMHLPPFVPEKNIPVILGAFIRAITIAWDRFSADPDSRNELQERTGNSYNKAIAKEFRGAASVLKLLRNTFSHHSDIPIKLDCRIAALVFVFNMRTMYALDNVPMLSDIEDSLLFSDIQRYCGEEYMHYRLQMQESNSDVKKLAKYKGMILAKENRDGNTLERGMGDLLRELQKTSAPEYQANAIQWLFKMFWYELLGDVLEKSGVEFERQFKKINKSDDPLHKVAVASLYLAFSPPKSA